MKIFTTPPVCDEGDTIEMIVDFDNRKIEFIINENSIFTTKLRNEGMPVFLVAGMNKGTLEII